MITRPAAPCQRSLWHCLWYCDISVEDHVCLRTCLSSDSGPAKLASQCKPDTFYCTRGSKTYDNHGNPYCLSGCKENSLIPVRTEVNHGRAFLPCICSNFGEFNRICRHRIENGPVVLHCHDGFGLVVSSPPCWNSPSMSVDSMKPLDIFQESRMVFLASCTVDDHHCQSACTKTDENVHVRCFTVNFVFLRVDRGFREASS